MSTSRQEAATSSDYSEGGTGADLPPIAMCAVVPERTDDRQRARELFARDGAVIWSGGSGTEFEDAAAIPCDIFGSVRSSLPPIKICYGNGAVGETDVQRNGSAHTDGYAYGVSRRLSRQNNRPCKFKTH